MKVVRRVFFFGILDALITIQVFVYIWLIIKSIKKHNIKIGDFYSYSENISFNWLKFVLFVYFLFFVLFFIVGNTFDFYKENNILTVYYLTQLIIVLLIVSFGLKQKQAGFEDIEQHNCESTFTTMSFEAKEELYTQLQDIIKKDKIFLDSNLKIDQLAGRLNTNRTYLSAVIREKSGLNFCNYVNKFRVEEFLELTDEITNAEKFNIEGIARNVGFKSKSSFYCAFRKEKNCTPLEFLKKKSKS
jgi:AraC-like DNA-binding protein